MKQWLRVQVVLILFVAVCGSVDAQAPYGALPEGITLIPDIPYVSEGHDRQKLNLYLPSVDSSKPLPVIVWIHAGDWRTGSKERCYPVRRGFAERGYVIASVGYRLSIHEKFPAQLEDVKAAVRWLRANAKEYNLDPDRIAVWGASGGGYIAQFLAVTGDEKRYDKGENLEFSSKANAVITFFVISDLADPVMMKANADYLLPGSAVVDLLGFDKSDPDHMTKLVEASPIYRVSPNSSPALICYGDGERLMPVSQGEKLDAAYRKAGVPSVYYFVKGAHFFSRHYYTEEFTNVVASFLGEHLKESAQEEKVLVATE